MGRKAQRRLVWTRSIRSPPLLLVAACALVLLWRRRAADGVVAAAVEAGAGAHGFVKKAGPLDPKKWQPGFKDLRLNRTRDWLAQHDASLAAGAPLPPLQVLTACQVLVNHLYKVVYLRHAKTGSSSLLCHLKGCKKDGSGGGNRTEAEQAALSFEPLQALAPNELADLWRDYFVVTFVRNPFTRAVSSYRMAMRGMSRVGLDAYPGWNSFCADPAGFASVCAADPICSKRGEGFVFDHVNPQSDCLLAEDGGWAVDFIGRTEAIDEDLAAVLAELERRRPADAPPVPPLEHKLENVNGRGCIETEAKGHNMAREQYCDQADYFRGRHSACFAAVRQQYQGDVAALRFGPGSGGGSAGGRRAAAGGARQRA